MSAGASDQRVAVVTGGAGGLAQALARQLGAAGFLVAAPDRAALDVRDGGSVRAFFGGLGRVDLLVTAAAVTGDALSARMGEAEWTRVVDTNLRGTFLCARVAARDMVRKRSGHIVTVGSFSALDGPVGQSAYAASKAGVIALTKSLAAELGPRDVRANCVLPGFLETRMTAAVPAARREEIRQRHVLGRFNTV